MITLIFVCENGLKEIVCFYRLRKGKPPEAESEVASRFLCPLFPV